MNTQKGAANLISTMAYILISFVVIGVVSVPTLQLINNSKERANYNSMFEFFDKFEMALEDTISNKQITEINFYNPGEIEIDCTNNKIIGRVEYSGEYKTEEVIVNNIITYKKNEQIIFEKNLNNYERIQLNCGDKILSKGKNTLTINQFRFNEETGKIEIDIYKKLNEHKDADWYNSNWAYRTKITIDKDKVEGGVSNFPMLVKINSSKYQYIPNYYIEDDGTNKYLWTKVSLNAGETKKIFVKKENGYTPDGEKVFDFFDDFEGPTINTEKWEIIGNTWIQEDGYVSVPLTGTANTSFSLLISNNFVIKDGILESLIIPLNSCNSCGKGIIYRAENLSNIYTSVMEGWNTNHTEIGKRVNGGWTKLNYNTTLGNVLADTKYKIKTTIVDTSINTSITNVLSEQTTEVSTTDNSFEQGGVGLIVDRDETKTGAKYDYIFARKHTTLEPTINITDHSNYYVIEIKNIDDKDLIDYQIRVLGNELNITSKTESINLTEKEQPKIDLSLANEDGSDILFTLGDGKTKLKREVEYFSSKKVLPYYIEEDGFDSYLWTKISLEPNETKTLVLKKTNNDTPNGNAIFNFFDNFEGADVDLQKWAINSSNYTSTETSVRLRTGSITLKNPLDFDLKENYVIKVRAKQLQTSGGYGGALPSICSSNYYTSNNGTTQALIAPQKYTGSNNNIYLYAANGASSSNNVANNVHITTYNINKFNIFETIIMGNTFEINKNYETLYSSATVNFVKELKYLTLGYGVNNATFDISDTEYDYIFVRKYTPIEPTITTQKMGDDYVITVTNTQNVPLTNYQIKILASDVEVFSKKRSLEITDVSFQESQNELVSWVKIPKLSSEEDTVIYMYFGNHKAQEENDKEVWDDDYLMVQHLNETPKNNVVGFFDSTKNNNNGTAIGFDDINSTTNIKGKIGKGNKHNIVIDPESISGGIYPTENTSNFVNFGKIYNNDWNYQTISVWVNWDGNTNQVYSLVYGDYRNSNFGRFLINSNTKILLQNGNESFYNSTVSKNNWNHIVYRYNLDENKEALYINGIKEERERLINIKNNSSTLKLGYADLYAFSGILDEFRVSNTARSDEWIITEYNNQNEPETFYTISEKENQ